VVSCAPPFGCVIDTGLVGINHTLRKLAKRGVQHALIEPDWDGKKKLVKYLRWKRVANKLDELLDKVGWPHDIRGDYKNWGGHKPLEIEVITRVVKTKRGSLLPVAFGIKSDVVYHNALLTRQLLDARSIPSAIGWWKCVDTSKEVVADTLKPLSNKYGLPKPQRWRIVEL
jgi:hypothetical protein